MFPTEVPYAVYFDKAGAPLDNGYLYFGVENQNPETSSLQVFWDLAGTQPVAQPVRTIAGYPVRAGTIANIYANAAYSQTVRDSKGNLVSYSASSTARNPFGGTTSFALTDTEAISTTTSSFRFTRNANYPGGTPGYVNACVIGETFVNNAAASAYEWAGLFVLHNSATGGQNVGSYSQGIRANGAGPTWGATNEVIDLNTTAPTSGVVGLEVDVRGNTLDPNHCRVGIDVVYSRQGLVGANMGAYYGVRIQDAGDHAGAVLGTGFGFGVGCVVGIGLDTSPATITGAAIKMAQGQVIQFNDAVGATVRQMVYDGTSLKLANTTGTTYWSLGDNGAMAVGAAAGFTLTDQAGASLFSAQRIASAVNSVTVKNATTTNAPGVYATGTDTNVELLLQGKGNLGVKLVDGAGGLKFQCNTTGIAFFGGGVVAKPTVTGAKGGNAALTSLMTALSSLGLVADTTT